MKQGRVSRRTTNKGKQTITIPVMIWLITLHVKHGIKGIKKRTRYVYIAMKITYPKINLNDRRQRKFGLIHLLKL